MVLFLNERTPSLSVGLWIFYTRRALLGVRSPQHITEIAVSFHHEALRKNHGSLFVALLHGVWAYPFCDLAFVLHPLGF